MNEAPDEVIEAARRFRYLLTKHGLENTAVVHGLGTEQAHKIAEMNAGINRALNEQGFERAADAGH